jgi:thioredoxin-related protein
MLMEKTIAFLFMALLGLTMQSPSLAGTGTIDWQAYDQAQKQGQGESHKYLLYFRTPRCGYCRKLEAETLADEQVAAYINSHFKPVLIDADKSPKVAAQHGVRGVPDLHFMSPDGEKIANLPGFIEAAQLLPLLQYIHTDSYLKMSLSDFLQQR